MIRAASELSNKPTILLVTPPPLHEAHLEVEDRKKGTPITRVQAVTAQYAQTVRDVAAEAQANGQNVVLVDLWKAIIDEAFRLTATWPNDADSIGTRKCGFSAPLRTLLVDGLHLTGDGYRLFLEEVSVS